MPLDVAVRDAELVVLGDAEIGPDLCEVELVDADPELVQHALDKE